MLDQVWLSDSKGPDPGRGCSGRGDYSDLAPGGLVIVSEPSGVALATASLGAGTLRMKVKGGTDERRRRDELITSIFNLRIARSDAEGNDVKSADLRLQLAKTRLAEAENPNLSTLPFEGNTFQAAYCHFEFSSSGLKDVRSYSITVTHRGGVAFAQDALAANGWVAALAIGT